MSPSSLRANPSVTRTQALQGNKQKLEFRVRWAGAQFENIRKGRVFTEAFRRVDLSVGTYRPFQAIVREEGGKDDPEAVAAATRICVKCTQMGEPWVSYNKMSERLEFLYVVRSNCDCRAKHHGPSSAGRRGA